MNLKPLVAVLLLTLPAAASVFIYDSKLTPGAGLNIFTRVVAGTRPDTIYTWQTSTNLFTWEDSGPPFVGFGFDVKFFSLVATNEPARFFRVKVLGPF